MVFARFLGDRRVDLRTEAGRLGQLGAVQKFFLSARWSRVPACRAGGSMRIGWDSGGPGSTRIGDRPAPAVAGRFFAASAAGRAGCAVAGRACFRGAFRFAASPRG